MMNDLLQFRDATLRTDASRRFDREDRAREAREKRYVEYLRLTQKYGSTGAPPPPEFQLAGFSHFHAAGFGDAGGSGATLPADVLIDPVGTGNRAALGVKLGAQLRSLPPWVQVATFIGVGALSLFAVGFVVRGFR